MPNPIWSAEYAFNQAPEANGFTRRESGSPVITEQTSGTPANRRVEINSDNGDAVWATTTVPALDPLVGTTTEFQTRVSGSGDAGVETTFLTFAVLCMVWENMISVSQPRGDNGDPGGETEIATASNAVDTLVRFNFSPDRTVTVYRNGIEIHSFTANVITKPFQRVLWWGEGGGTQVFNIFRYYNGGSVPPG